MGRRRWVAALVCLAALGGCDGPGPGRAGVPGPPEPRLFHGQVAPGTRARYAFSWLSQGSHGWAVAAESAAGAEVDASGVLELEVHAPDSPGGDHPVRLAFSALTVRAWQVAGIPVEVTADELPTTALALALAPDGVVRAGTTERGDGGALLALRTVAALLVRQEPAGAPPGWSARERTPFGEARTRWARSQHGALARSLEVWGALDGAPGGAALVGSGLRQQAFTGEGLPWVLDDTQEAVAILPGGARPVEVALRFTLRLEGAEHAPPRPLDEGAWQAATLDPRSPIETPAARRQALLGRVGGLTRGRVLDRITIAATGGGPEDDGRFLFQATGLLLLEPELCTVVGARIGDRLASPTGDFLAADLLTFAGSPEAQRALIAALSAPADGGTADPRSARTAWLHYPLLLQRLGLVARPLPEVADFLVSVRRDAGAGTEPALAADYALGAVAGRLARQGDAAVARRLVRLLEAEVDAAADPTRLGHALIALGNTRLDAVAPRLVGATRHPDTEVRRAATVALRGVPGAAARGALLALALDAGVATDALIALRDHVLTAGERATLARHVAGERVPAPADVEVATLLAAQRPAAAELGPAVAVLREHARTRPALEPLLAAFVDLPGPPGASSPPPHPVDPP